MQNKALKWLNQGKWLNIEQSMESREKEITEILKAYEYEHPKVHFLYVLPQRDQACNEFLEKHSRVTIFPREVDVRVAGFHKENLLIVLQDPTPFHLDWAGLMCTSKRDHVCMLVGGYPLRPDIVKINLDNGKSNTD